jgi:hypothetical protein
MEFSEVMIYFDYKMSNIARALDVTRETVTHWKDEGKIPYHRQCQIEVVTGGKLKAEGEKKNNKE